MTSPNERHDGRQDGLLRELSEAECWRHLAGPSVGRVSYADRDGPVILPLNFLARDNKIWFRTASYTQMAVHLPGQQAAFEIDEIDARTHAGWSVLVRGRAEHVLDARSLATWPEPAPWADGTRTMLFCLTPNEVTGRVLQQADVSPAPGFGPGTIQRGGAGA